LSRSSCLTNTALRIALGLALPCAAAPAAAEAPVRNGFRLEPASIPVDQIIRGGPPRDGIPSLDHPPSVPAAEAPWADDDVVIGVAVGGEARAYPTGILARHGELTQYSKKTRPQEVALAVATAIAPALFSHLAAPLLTMMLAGYATAAFWWCRGSEKSTDAEPPIRNPFELLPALKFGLLLGGVTLLAHALREWAGESGLYVLAVVSGMTDVDAITLSLAGFVEDDVAVAVAATGIVIAAMANTAFKAGLVMVVGGRASGLRVAAAAAIILLTGAIALAF